MATTISVFKTVKGVTPIRVGRRVFVSGLYWEVLPNGSNYQDAARKIARRERDRTGVTMDVVYLRRHVDIVQAGFAVRGGRARKGTVSLAAVAIDALGPTFIAAFPLPDGLYAVTSGSNNAIVPDSEGVYVQEEAQQRVMDLWGSLAGTVGNGDLPVYAPPEIWPDGRPMALEELLPKAKRSHRLRQRASVSGRGALTWLAWAGGAAALAAGWFGWEAYQAQLAEIEAASRRPAKRVETADLSLMRPWTHQAPLGQFATTCTNAIGELPLTLDGWMLLKAQCSATSVTASYARTEGRTVLGFRAKAQAWAPQAGIRFSSDGDLATIEKTVQLSPAGDEGLASIDDRANAFMTYWQERLLPFELRSVGSKLAQGYVPPSENGGEDLARPHWRTMTWSVPSTSRNPIALLSDLDPSGIRLQEVAMDFGGQGKLQWSLKGEIYGD